MGKRLEGAAEGVGLMGRGAFQPCGRAAEVDATPRLLHSVRLGLHVQRCGKRRFGAAPDRGEAPGVHYKACAAAALRLRPVGRREPARGRLEPRLVALHDGLCVRPSCSTHTYWLSSLA